ncbi:hypothetical protein [Pseudomonas kurunegalensis]|uniref:hypothetical protein n=1 Tax=Pseudomonas kurunegalensis TaxID=485880 RepID=UPI0023642A0F|nr:hypothetical protein [Pseudomonas kurunegalensis]MDD2136971.1 hypothetical protein [Pseudomonas kurunegalensis]
MENSIDYVIAETINRLSAGAERQNALNKAFFMVITELLKSAALSENAVKALLKRCEADEGLPPETRQNFRELSDHVKADYNRYQLLTELMLDAMQGNRDDMETKLNELFRKQES